MRRLSGALIAALIVMGCDGGVSAVDAGVDAGEGPPVYVDLQYSVRCDGCDTVDVDVCGFVGSDSCVEGTPSVAAECRYDATSGGFMLRARQSGSPELTISTEAGCTVTLELDGEMFTGSCSRSAPSAAIPCQVTSLPQLDADPPVIDGQVFCVGLRGTSGTRSITAAGLGPTAAMTPGRFTIAGCDGL